MLFSNLIMFFNILYDGDYFERARAHRYRERAAGG
jgi:hypothetical protein